MNKCIAPPFLKKGDKVALLSPAYHTPMENVEGAARVLREWGFEPVIGRNVDRLYRGEYAGTPEERLEDLMWALKDPSIKAIICNRGGYGTIGLVNRLPLEVFMNNPKWLVGFSDITTLGGMETRAGVMSIHGTMGKFLAASLGKDVSGELLRKLLYGTVPEYTLPVHPLNIEGTAKGTLVGGNLATFTPVLGTAADATAGRRDIILFIEEVEEDMSHIDRLFTTLVLNGVLRRCRGVILGEFTDCKANQDYACVEELLCSYLKDYGIPVCCGFPAGHGEMNLPLVMGSAVTLKVAAGGASVSFGMGKRITPLANFTIGGGVL